ncbi:hypothetical protein C1J03_05205 [Sulfitobacter sp. SK012]|uniref:site-2 protease family protein n=1 Tax=Sulfitobacter sp. SK012 TaxID=1389005 RepID=UPI000E10CE96|nr:site-2 protease family protein [Sulfitobacter sp. SK012]AXI45486.1 hypothetical protein C1J03_05205 [Sulfitobacter sp. SK012]
MFSTGSTLFSFRGPFGVPIEVHSSLIFLIFILMAAGSSVVALFYSAIFIVMLVGSIFLHEMGHAWGCLVQGIPVRRVVIFGGGGFCEYGSSPSHHEQELIVAMGPIVNLTVWALASLAWPYLPNEVVAWVFIVLAQINLFLAVLNMLPAHPLDGGKLFRLALMRFLPAQTATHISGLVGLIIAVLWIPAMIYSFITYGLLLFFMPSIRLHWQMLKA